MPTGLFAETLLIYIFKWVHDFTPGYFLKTDFHKYSFP